MGVTDQEPLNIIAQKVIVARMEGMRLWEEELTLILRPRPSWLPAFIWRQMIRLVVYQTSKLKYGDK